MADPAAYPDPGPPPGMPRWVKVSGIIIGALVLLFVILRVTGVGGEHGPGMHGPGAQAPVGDHKGDTPPIDGAPELAFTAEGLAFDPDRIELPAGRPVNVALRPADTPHDLVVDEIDFHLTADREETVIGGLVFDEPGTYVGYCSLEGHREAGMELEFVVTASDSGHTPPVDHG
jgi:plastocyanin